MFKGKYGPDRLGYFLLILSITVSVSAMFATDILPQRLLIASSTLILGVALLRMFSTKFEIRKRELAAYAAIEYRVLALFNRVGYGIRRIFSKQERGFKVFICPKCHQRLRTPRGKGTIQISCRRCGNKFIRKT